MSKKNRDKITFSTINGDAYSLISTQDLAESNKRVKNAMKAVIRNFDKKEAKSQQEATLLVLNA